MKKTRTLAQKRAYKAKRKQIEREICGANKQLVEDFMQYCESIHRSKDYISKCRQDLKVVMTWATLKNRNKLFAQWTQRNIASLTRWLAKEGIDGMGFSRLRIQRILWHVDALGRFVENELHNEFPGYINVITLREQYLQQTHQEE